MLRPILLIAAAFASPLFADDKKDEKKPDTIDPAKLVGEWRQKSVPSGLPVPIVAVVEFTKTGEMTSRHAPPDDIPSAVLQAIGTYKLSGTAVEAAINMVDPETGKPKADAKAQPDTMEIVKLTDTELHLKMRHEDRIVKEQVMEFVRVTADDKDRSVDTAKLVGRWKMKTHGQEWSKKGTVPVIEFTEGGKWFEFSASTDDLTRGEKDRDGAYVLKDKTVTITYKEVRHKDAEATTTKWEILKLTDTGLALRLAEGSDKGVAIGYERVKEMKVEKIDPAKLVGEWTPKEKERSVGLPVDVQPVYEYGKGGEVKVKHAQPDHLAGGIVYSTGTYTVTGSTLEQTVAELDKEGKPRKGVEPGTESMEVVKLTDAELHLKADKEVVVWRRLTADDKDTTVDTAKLVGRWRTSPMGASWTDPKDEFVVFFEFTQDGKVVRSATPVKGPSKAEKAAEGTYTVKDRTLEVTHKAEGGKAETKVYDLVRLTDTRLVFRSATGDRFEKWAVTAFERVKDEKEADKKGGKPAKDEEAILGTWTFAKAESLVEGGKDGAADSLRKVTITFAKGGTATETDAEGKQKQVTYKLDPAAKPRAIDLTADGRPDVAGVYELDGDTLTICSGEGKDRPTELKADDKGVVVITLKRAKDGPKKDR